MNLIENASIFFSLFIFASQQCVKEWVHIVRCKWKVSSSVRVNVRARPAAGHNLASLGQRTGRCPRFSRWSLWCVFVASRHLAHCGQLYAPSDKQTGILLHTRRIWLIRSDKYVFISFFIPVRHCASGKAHCTAADHRSWWWLWSCRWFSVSNARYTGDAHSFTKPLFTWW